MSAGGNAVELVFFDLETTDKDPDTARIVEMALVTVASGNQQIEWTRRFNPGVPIMPGATAVHGITDADVAGEPSFADLAPTIQAAVEGRVLVGYNSRRFDTIILDAELRRAGQPGLARGPHGELAPREVDLYAVWQAMEARNLTTAARRFAGVDLGDDAHQALDDTRVLVGVFKGMAAEFGLQSASAFLDASTPANAVDRAGKFRREPDGTVVFGFGKHDGKPVSSEPDYLRWMLSKDFSADTKAWTQRLLSAAEQG